MENKTCSKCNTEKTLSDFGLRNDSKDGYQSQCKICKNLTTKIYQQQSRDKQKEYRNNNKEKIKEYKINNKEKIKEINHIWYLNNKDKSIKRSKQWAKNNRKKATLSSLKSNKKRKLIDPVFNLQNKVRVNINKSLSRFGYTKKSKTHEILGCTYKEFALCRITMERLDVLG